MELTILGTAAAEGWPAPFCRCAACEGARKRGGPNIRTRSGALIDDDLKIDFCPDTVVQMQKLNRCLDTIRALVFTHQHSDHFAPSELEWVVPGFTRTAPKEPIAVYGNVAVVEGISSFFKGNLTRPNLTLHLLEPGVAVKTPVGDTILPLLADHGAPGALVLRITRAKDGKSFFYGHDSGFYPEAVLDALAAEGPVDVALFDCTSGGKSSSNRNHMDASGVVKMAQTLKEQGIASPETRLVATHFSHNGDLLHEELVEYFLPHGIRVAFDGMVIDV